jgi:hypothetical protein
MAQADLTKLAQAPCTCTNAATQKPGRDEAVPDLLHRQPADIAVEIRGRRVKTSGDAIAIGALLIEAKAQLPHGRWLPWLLQEFGYSPRTAQNYIQAYKFALDPRNNSDLNLAPTALYRLARKAAIV